MASDQLRRLTYVPPLDGIRGVLVFPVLAYHFTLTAGMHTRLLPGAFLAPSVFFVLSGFLITYLLLAEHDRQGRIDWRGFWQRRFRRLLPASTFVVFLCVVLRAGWPSVMAPLPVPDVTASLLSFRNWQAIHLEHTSPGLRLLGPLSPYWSLAVEEQFYFGLSLIVGLAALTRRLRTVATVALVLVAGLSVVRFLTVDGTTNRMLFGTDTRAAEVAVGCLLALAVARWGWPAHRRWSALAWVGLAGTAASWLFITEAHSWVLHGGVPLAAVVAGAMIPGSFVPGTFNRALSWRPLVEIGKISYPVYLVHWPIALLMRQEEVGFGGIRLVALNLAVSLAVGWLLGEIIEAPIRRRTLLRRPGSAPAAWLAVVAASILGAWAFNDRVGADVPVPWWTVMAVLLALGGVWRAWLTLPPSEPFRPRVLRPAPALTGLRGPLVVAILGVHIVFMNQGDWSWSLRGGFYAVDAFLVLSGFLMTLSLCRSFDRGQAVPLLATLRRRYVRLLVPVAALFAVHAVIVVVIGDSIREEVRQIAMAFTLTSNWQLAVGHTNRALDLVHLWSLALEGQMYLICVPLLVLVRTWLRRDQGRRVLFAAIGVVAVVVLWRSFASTRTALPVLYERTDTRADAVLVGIATALVWRARLIPSSVLRIAGPIGAAFMVSMWLFTSADAPWAFHGGFTLDCVAAAAVVLAALESGSIVERICRWAPLQWLGRYSYGIYLWHLPVYVWVTRLAPSAPLPLKVAVAVPVTLGLAVAAYRLVERRVLPIPAPVQAGSDTQEHSRTPDPSSASIR